MGDKLDIIKIAEDRRLLTEKRKNDVRHASKIEVQKRLKIKPFEQKLFKKFKQITKTYDYIKLDHIDALGLDYDVLFITTVKNTGKTVNIIFNRFWHYYLKGQKVVYIRNSIGEFEKHLKEFNASKKNPFKAVLKGGTYVLIDKKNLEECGICTDMKSSNSVSGGEFEDYGAIIFDEALTWNPNNIINESHIYNLLVLPSSIQRSKKEKIKVYLTSNIPPTKKNLILLDYLGIDLDENLRYIVRGNVNNPEVNCKILYINAGGDIFKGINAQDGAAQMASQSAKLLIGSNKIISSYDNTLGTDIFAFLDSKFAFIYTHKKIDYLLQLKWAIDEDKDDRKLYCVCGGVYDPALYVESIIYTDNRLVSSMYGRSVKLIGNIKWYKSQIITLMRQKKLNFANDISVEVTRCLYEEYMKDYPLLF